MRLREGVVVAIAIAVAILITGCAHKVVSRISPESTTDLSGRWNDTDSRLVSEEMIEDCLSRPWLLTHSSRHEQRPGVIVGRVRNESEEHIATGTFTGDIERALINSGRVRMAASAEEREQVRDERADQQEFASEESMKRWGRERGADYLMGGVIHTITDQERGETVIFYQIDLNLVDLESNEKVWQGQKKIKKFIGRHKVRL